MVDITVWETTESKTIQDSEFVITNVRIRSVFFDTMGSRARAGDILSIMLFTLPVYEWSGKSYQILIIFARMLTGLINELFDRRQPRSFNL